MAINIKTTGSLAANGVKVLVYGQAGAGKTSLIKSLPNPIVLSAEGGLLPPPRARGSTFCDKSKPIRPHASPACAGIDPGQMFSPPSARGLPRVRGDRPPIRPVLAFLTRPPPRARGSTFFSVPRCQVPDDYVALL